MRQTFRQTDRQTGNRTLRATKEFGRNETKLADRSILSTAHAQQAVNTFCIQIPIYEGKLK